ncbi:MAG: hypothetical protein COV72_00260 [Candidatus Omnitrophica bacterium CG11_big_fil_rev_8_21_14_0_20_42_13]|uniref:Uncharacterized protein n=1 Tax=Candidatus Ghiorseimicrobium undicola TaxID=1974746 RepID=A0A2H0LZX8_9BACT|nr:MAG: hypothetical protein COV72_00260 [Candidatus Omnitrophica bacterium CG11_big_fil_rev_8_21_14_0_20_42_13]
MRKVLAIIAVLTLFLSAATSGMAAQKLIPVSATIQGTSQLNVGISKVDATTQVWTAGQSSIAFGTLTFDTTNSIFTAANYYVVDVGVVNNTGAWTLSVGATSITNGTANLDNNINVTVVEQVNSSTEGATLDKISYGASNGKSYSSASIAAGSWIRLYYGIATGLADNPGVTPIGTSKPAGSYSGTITLTLA